MGTASVNPERAGGNPERPSKFAATGVCGCGLGRLRYSCRLFFRLIRERSPTFAYHRVAFLTQVKDGGE